MVCLAGIGGMCHFVSIACPLDTSPFYWCVDTKNIGYLVFLYPGFVLSGCNIFFCHIAAIYRRTSGNPGFHGIEIRTGLETAWSAGRLFLSARIRSSDCQNRNRNRTNELFLFHAALADDFASDRFISGMGFSFCGELLGGVIGTAPDSDLLFNSQSFL